MTRRISAILWVVTAAAAAGATTALRAAGNATRGGAAARVRAEAAGRDADIAFYVRRVAADPIGAADRSWLAGLYLQRARETADFGDYPRAARLAARGPALPGGCSTGRWRMRRVGPTCRPSRSPGSICGWATSRCAPGD